MTKEITVKDVTGNKVSVGKNIEFPAIGNTQSITTFKKQLNRLRHIEARTFVTGDDGASLMVSLTPAHRKKLVVCKRVVNLAKQNEVRIPAWVNSWASKAGRQVPVKAVRKTRRVRRTHFKAVRQPMTLGQRIKKAFKILVG